MKVQSQGIGRGPTNIDQPNEYEYGCASSEMKQTMEKMEKGPTIDEVD